MPRTPAVLDHTVKRRRLDETLFSPECKNYSSAVSGTDSLERQLRQEELLGMMTEVTDTPTRQLYPGNILRIANSGAIEKG